MPRLQFWIVGVIAFVALGGCSRKPKDQKAQVSYAIGSSFGKSLKAQGLDLDNKALANGIVDGYGGKEMELTEAEMQAALSKLSENRQSEMKKLADENKVKAEQFMAKNKDEEGVKTTKTGLQYKITEEGSGPAPKMDDTVVVNYKGTLIDGTEFDSSRRLGRPAEFPIKGVIPGWTEGLQLMKKGGKAMFYVPPELGYGDRPRQQIPPNAVLIFEVELLDVKASPPAKPAAKPPGKAH